MTKVQVKAPPPPPGAQASAGNAPPPPPPPINIAALPVEKKIINPLDTIISQPDSKERKTVMEIGLKPDQIQ
jgi:hypothetical protein